jgi:heptaprenyl diphosphate synthase
MTKTKKLTLLSLLLAQALALHFIERAFPLPIAVPGVKLGLANIITLITIISFGFKEAIIVVVGRTFLGALFGGGFSAFLFSVSGGLLSTIIMSIMYKKFIKFFSIPAVSITGAIFHNIGQIAVASFVVENINLFFYLPILIISGVITGLFIGLVVQFTLKPLNNAIQLTSTSIKP